MKQAHLNIFANHAFEVTKSKCLTYFLSLSTDKLFAEYLQQYFYLTNISLQPEPICNIDENNEVLPFLFQVNDIKIRIEKHLIHLDFPFIFRAIADFLPMQKAVINLCSSWLKPMGATELIFCPSHWQQTQIEMHTEWGKKRLEQLQKKIISQSSSYKRVKLNLCHCLGDSVSNFEEIKQKNYRTWLKLSLI